MHSDGERGDEHRAMQHLQVVERLPRAVSPLSPPPRKRRLIRSVSVESPYEEQSADVYASSSDSDDVSSEDCISPYTAPSVESPNLAEFLLMTEDRDRVDFLRRQRRSSSLPPLPPALRNTRPQHTLQQGPQGAPIHELQHEPQDELQHSSQRDAENT